MAMAKSTIEYQGPNNIYVGIEKYHLLIFYHNLTSGLGAYCMIIF